MLSNDPLFQKYCDVHVVNPTGILYDKEMAAEYLRAFCHVESRRDIRPDTEAANRLDLLESAFICWRDKDAFVEP